MILATRSWSLFALLLLVLAPRPAAQAGGAPASDPAGDLDAGALEAALRAESAG